MGGGARKAKFYTAYLGGGDFFAHDGFFLRVRLYSVLGAFFVRKAL